MADFDKMSGRAVETFLEKWSNHPLSVFIVAIAVTFAFIFLTLHSPINEVSIKLVGYTYIYSFLVLSLFSLILWTKKQALYNIFEVLTNHLKERVHILQESLGDIQIGSVGEPYEQRLEWLCPKSATPPISEQMRESVSIYENLVHIHSDCGMSVKDIDNRTKLELAKFYYKDMKFEKALRYVNSISYYKPIGKFLKSKENEHIKNEANFCKGLILQGLERYDESKESFSESGHKKSGCFICMMNADSEDQNKIQEFIDKAKKCDKSQLMKHCINKLSTAYYEKAKAKYKDGNDIKNYVINMKEAIKIANKAITNFNSWTALYNKACDLSMMASLKISYRDEDEYNQNTEMQMKEEIISCLEQSFQQKPALVVHSRTDSDLEWVKQNYPQEFYAIIGRTYHENHELLL